MRRIIITVPKSDYRMWKVSFGKNGRISRTSPVMVYRAVEKRLLASSEGIKTVVRVKYGEDVTNETLASTNASYLLYTLACFLEDFLPKTFLKEREGKYLVGFSEANLY